MMAPEAYGYSPVWPFASPNLLVFIKTVRVLA